MTNVEPVTAAAAAERKVDAADVSVIPNIILSLDEERDHYTRLYVSTNSIVQSKKDGAWFYLMNPERIHQIKLDAICKDQQPILTHLYAFMQREFSERRRFDHNYDAILSAVLESLEKFGFNFSSTPTVNIDGDENGTIGHIITDEDPDEPPKKNVFHCLVAIFFNRDPTLLRRLIRPLLKLPTFQAKCLHYYTRPTSTQRANNIDTTITIYECLAQWYRPYGWSRQFDHMTADPKQKTEGYAKLQSQFEVIGEIMKADSLTPNQSRVNLQRLFDTIFAHWMGPSADITTRLFDDRDEYVLKFNSEVPCEVISRFLLSIPAPFLLQMNLSSPRLQSCAGQDITEMIQLPSYIEIIQAIITRWKFNSPALLLERVFMTVVQWQQQQHITENQSSNEHKDDPSTCIDIHRYLGSILANLSVSLAPWNLLHAISNHPSAASLAQKIHTFLITTPDCLTLFESHTFLHSKNPYIGRRRTLFGYLLSEYAQFMPGDETILFALLERALQSEPSVAGQLLVELVLLRPTPTLWILKLYSLLLPLQTLPHSSTLPENVIRLDDDPLILFIDRLVKKEFKVSPADRTTVDWTKVNLLCAAFPNDLHRIYTLITHCCLRSKYHHRLRLWLASPFMTESVNTCPIFWLTSVVDHFIQLVGMHFYVNKMITIIWKELRTTYETNNSAVIKAIHPILEGECQLPSDLVDYVILHYLHHPHLTEQFPFTRVSTANQMSVTSSVSDIDEEEKLLLDHPLPDIDNSSLAIQLMCQVAHYALPGSSVPQGMGIFGEQWGMRLRQRCQPDDQEKGDQLVRIGVALQRDPSSLAIRALVRDFSAAGTAIPKEIVLEIVHGLKLHIMPQPIQHEPDDGDDAADLAEEDALIASIDPVLLAQQTIGENTITNQFIPSPVLIDVLKQHL